MAKQILVVGAIIALILVMAIVALAHVPQLISFQGKLYDDTGNPITGQVEVTFRIYNLETGGTALWSETINVESENGLYNVTLGQITALNLDFDGQYWLGVQITGDDELWPRYRLVSVPTAFRAQVANQVSWTNLTDVPEGFADGTDDVGEDGGISQVNAGTGITVTDPTGPTATVAADIGPGAEQVASGDHSHDDDYVNEGQANSITNSMILNEAVTSPKIVIPLILRESVDSPHSIISCINDSETGFGVYGRNDDSGNYGYLGSQYYGIAGISESGTSVYGSSTTGNGVYGRSSSGLGVKGFNSTSENEGYIGGTDYGVYGQHESGNYGYIGSNSYGVYGQSDKVGGNGVVGVAHSGQAARGVKGISDSGTGVEGHGYRTGVYGFASRDGGQGVYGICSGEGGIGVWGAGDIGVDGTSTNGTGVHGESYQANAGVFENTNSSNAWSTLYAITNGPGWAVHARSTHSSGHAGYFEGNVTITGYVGIGDSSPTYRLELPNTASAAGQGRANQWVTYSSKEYKKEITALEAEDYADVLKEILNMDLVYYHYQNQEDDRRYLGVIAEDAPEQVVTPDKKGLSLSEFAAFAIAGLKAQQAEIEELKKEVHILRKELSE